ncbi:SWIRM domain profile [Nakaseomyces glabratus]
MVLQSPQLEQAELYSKTPHAERNCSIDSILNNSSNSFNIPSPPLSPLAASVPTRHRRNLSIDSLDLNQPQGIQTIDLDSQDAKKLRDDIYEYLTQYRMMEGLKKRWEAPSPAAYRHYHYNSGLEASPQRPVRRTREMSPPRSYAVPVYNTRVGPQPQGVSLGNNNFFYNTRYHHYTQLPPISQITGQSVLAKPKSVTKRHFASPPNSPPKKRKTERSPTSSQFQQHHNPNPNIVSIKAVASVPQYVPGISWEQLPDYSPPLSTLPDNKLCLRIEWKGNPMDLSVDPLRSKLHPAEIVLASILRLPCDLYLDSKKRLFLEKVYKLKKGMPFRKTDAQKACKIDVNKASRLFTAFEKVGWLEDHHFQKYLNDIQL